VCVCVCVCVCTHAIVGGPGTAGGVSRSEGCHVVSHSLFTSTLQYSPHGM